MVLVLGLHSVAVAGSAVALPFVHHSGSSVAVALLRWQTWKLAHWTWPAVVELSSSSVEEMGKLLLKYPTWQAAQGVAVAVAVLWKLWP